jgi:hypothetical protein
VAVPELVPDELALDVDVPDTLLVAVGEVVAVAVELEDIDADEVEVAVAVAEEELLLEALGEIICKLRAMLFFTDVTCVPRLV